MADFAHEQTDKEIAKLDKRIHAVYSEASKDIQKKLDDFNARYKVKEQIHLQDVKDGKWTQQDFDAWKQGQVFQGKQWEAKRDQIAHTLTNSNQIAVNMINGQTSGIFGMNATYMNYTLEHNTGVNFGFGIYNEQAVARLIKDNPQVLPKWKINEPKDYIWNKKQVNNAVTQGIIQGESLDQISKRISKGLVMKNENLSKTFAQTAMTEAQNAGRLESLREAEKLGIDIYKQWMATLDSHTRDSHADVDGESVPVNSKFSNGLMYPAEAGGDPKEVYNCRCTMVGDLKKFPAKYKRYNNEKGKPIQYMTYKDWLKAKSYGSAGHKASQGGKGKPIDYSKYGGEKTYEVLKKYDNVDAMIDDATNEEWKYINSLISSKNLDSAQLDALIQEAHNEGKPKPKMTAEEKAAKKAEADLKKAQDNLAKIQQEIANKGADKTFSGIWYNQDVTYADWESKKDSIASKKDYYEQQIEKYKNAGDLAMVTKMQDKLNELKEFEKNGAEYSKLYKQLNDAKQEVMNLTPKPTFKGGDYTQERKDKALWAQSPRDADKALRSKSGEVWRGATKIEKDAAYEYTLSYSKFNEPLRGWEYGQSNYHTGAGFKGVGNTDLNAGHANNGEYLNALTSIISKSTYDKDVWLQRGCRFGGMDKFFGCSEDLLKNGTQAELEMALLGTTPTELGFMSCGSSKGSGFHMDMTLNIFAPSGTQMLYVEPFSGFGNGDKRSWDGIREQQHFGNELETLLQQGTQFRVTKVERSSRGLFFDLEIISQDNVQLWKK